MLNKILTCIKLVIAYIRPCSRINSNGLLEYLPVMRITKTLLATCLSLTAVLLLSACVQSVPRLDKFEPNSAMIQERAIVVINTKNVDYIDFAIYDHNYIYPEYSADPTINPPDYVLTQHRIVKNSNLYSKYGYSSTIYALDPGIWYINFAFYSNNSDIYFTKKPGLTAESNVMYGAFEVHAGDILYLGDITFSWAKFSPFKMVTVTGDIELAKKELATSSYKKLIPFLKQAKFYPGGSKINYSCNGNCDCTTSITVCGK